jgi:hypothetical protein
MYFSSLLLKLMILKEIDLRKSNRIILLREDLKEFLEEIEKM